MTERNQVIDVAKLTTEAITSAQDLADALKTHCDPLTKLLENIDNDFANVVLLGHWGQEAQRLAKQYVDRWNFMCNVCTGHSPSWDGHNINPPCKMGALILLLRHLGIDIAWSGKVNE